jgi:hypothetical protein
VFPCCNRDRFPKLFSSPSLTPDVIPRHSMYLRKPTDIFRKESITPKNILSAVMTMFDLRAIACAAMWTRPVRDGTRKRASLE